MWAEVEYLAICCAFLRAYQWGLSKWGLTLLLARMTALGEGMIGIGLKQGLHRLHEVLIIMIVQSARIAIYKSDKTCIPLPMTWTCVCILRLGCNSWILRGVDVKLNGNGVAVDIIHVT
jgi:hypothetical protein